MIVSKVYKFKRKIKVSVIIGQGRRSDGRCSKKSDYEFCSFTLNFMAVKNQVTVTRTKVVNLPWKRYSNKDKRIKLAIKS
jgi:hypothetical protein